MATKQVEKVTFNIPSEMKAQLLSIKEELGVSMSTLYKDAIAAYIKNREIERWKRGAKLAKDDPQYQHFVQEISEAADDIHDYPAR